MSVIASKLIEKNKSLSQEEQEELSQQFQDSIQKMFSGLAQQLVGKPEMAMPSFKDFFKPSLKDFFKGWLTECMKETLRTGARYSEPAYIPPLFYPEQSQPQIVYVYVYEPPSLN
jgi:hypothetical protein